MARLAEATTVVRGATYGVAAALVAALLAWFVQALTQRPGPSGRQAGASHSQWERGSGVPQAGPGLSASLPRSLAGSSPPRLPVDAHGRLVHTRAVRDFFDYFLTAQHEIAPQALDRMVRRQIAAQLEGSPAQPDALDAWQRYTAYRTAVAQLAPLAVQGASEAPDLDAAQTALDAREAMAARTMGPVWAPAFFEAEWQRARYDLDRLRIGLDPSLSAAQKAARLAALDDTLPAPLRAVRERERRMQQSVDTVAVLQRENASPDALQAQLAQRIGPEAAARVADMQRENDAWRARYGDYAAQRARIVAMGLPAQERDAQIAQLQQRVFASSSEILRARSLDQASAVTP